MRTFARFALPVLFISAAAATWAQKPDLLERGKYLMNGPVACGNCHNTRAEDM